MVRDNPEQSSTDESERLAQTSSAAQSGWEQTLEDMERMAEDREASGYETLTVAASDTTPKPAESGDTNEWGLVYTVASNQAEELETFDTGVTFDNTAVYQARQSGHGFVVTECSDDDAEQVLFVAGTFQLRHAGQLVRTAVDREEMYTHIKRLSGETVRRIHHSEAEPFFPNPDSLMSYESGD